MAAPKKLYRSRTNRKIAGVCGGLGEYFNIDPTLIRLAAVFFTLWWGGGLILYFITWFVIPEEPESDFSETETNLLTDKSQIVSQQERGEMSGAGETDAPGEIPEA